MTFLVACCTIHGRCLLLRSEVLQSCRQPVSGQACRGAKQDYLHCSEDQMGQALCGSRRSHSKTLGAVISHVCLVWESKTNCSCIRSNEAVCTLSAGSTAKEVGEAVFAIG